MNDTDDTVDAAAEFFVLDDGKPIGTLAWVAVAVIIAVIAVYVFSF